jgi:hypothetical protein
VERGTPGHFPHQTRNLLVVVAETEIKNLAPDLSQSILPVLVLRSRLAAGLRALSPIKDIGKVDEVYFFLQSSIFGFVHDHLPPKHIGDLASPSEHSQKSIRETPRYGDVIPDAEVGYAHRGLGARNYSPR